MNETALVEQLSSGQTSAYRQYQRMFVGKSSLWSLLRYEVCASWVSPVPGALGYLLRKKLFPRVLGKVGRGTLFGRGVVLRCPGRIRLGEGVAIDDQVVLDAKGESSTIELGNRILVGRCGVLSCNDARITMKDFISVGPFCTFASKSFIDIGSNVSIGAGSHLLAGGHEFDDPEQPAILQRRTSQGIVIEDGVWLGAGVKVLDGARVGRNSIIGAGAVVKGEIPLNSVAVGMPARVLYNRLQGASRATPGVAGAGAVPHV
jgi:acetyltransferase-like isoleucine patch superfamily enzyme